MTNLMECNARSKSKRAILIVDPVAQSLRRSSMGFWQYMGLLIAIIVTGEEIKSAIRDEINSLS
jgi:hypothetical protein